MPVEKSAGAIIFHRDPGGKIEYLVLKNGLTKYWGLPKGWIEKGEDLKTTAMREIKEESGLKNLQILDGFKETIRYFLRAKYDYQIKSGAKKGQAIMKFVTYFLAESKDKNVKLSFEHEAFEWLEFDEAYERLIKNSHKQNAEVLKKAHLFLTKHDRF
jgi:8-oxo-dGTP pyrophosphatase MutT (NUDIX family)